MRTLTVDPCMIEPEDLIVGTHSPVHRVVFEDCRWSYYDRHGRHLTSRPLAGRIQIWVDDDFTPAHGIPRPL